MTTTAKKIASSSISRTTAAKPKPARPQPGPQEKFWRAGRHRHLWRSCWRREILGFASGAAATRKRRNSRRCSSVATRRRYNPRRAVGRVHEVLPGDGRSASAVGHPVAVDGRRER